MFQLEIIRTIALLSVPARGTRQYRAVGRSRTVSLGRHRVCSGSSSELLSAESMFLVEKIGKPPECNSDEGG